MFNPHDASVGANVSCGSWPTFTTTVVDPVHPLALVPTTEYVVETVGLAVTLLPVDADNPAEGNHKYVDAPCTCSAVELPVQMVVGLGCTERVNDGLTVTIVVVVAVHPPANVAVTV